MAEYIPRLLAPSILEAHQYFPVVVICGPRQSGETFRPTYTQNLRQIAANLPAYKVTTTLIYNGPSIPPLALNIRDL